MPPLSLSLVREAKHVQRATFWTVRLVQQLSVKFRKKGGDVFCPCNVFSYLF